VRPIRDTPGWPGTSGVRGHDGGARHRHAPRSRGPCLAVTITTAPAVDWLLPSPLLRTPWLPLPPVCPGPQQRCALTVVRESEPGGIPAAGRPKHLRENKMKHAEPAEIRLHSEQPATSNQYSSLRRDQHQPSATSQPNRLLEMMLPDPNRTCSKPSTKTAQMYNGTRSFFFLGGGGGGG
jgi:hypothetical protein